MLISSEPYCKASSSSFPRKVTISKCIINIADERDDAASRQMIEMLETIDDDLGEMEFDLVKVSDPEFADREYGIKRGAPAIVYFENGVPSVFDGEEDCITGRSN